MAEGDTVVTKAQDGPSAGIPSRDKTAPVTLSNSGTAMGKGEAIPPTPDPTIVLNVALANPKMRASNSESIAMYAIVSGIRELAPLT